MEVALVFAVATAAWTVSSERIFQPFRVWTKKKSEFLGTGIYCPFCTGGWISILVVPFCIYERTLVGYLTWYFICVGGSGVLTSLYAILRQLLKTLKIKASILAMESKQQERYHDIIARRWPTLDTVSEDATHAERLASIKKR